MPRLAVILAVVIALCAVAVPDAGAVKKKRCKGGTVWDPYLGECVSRRGSYF